ncbi:MAG: hypothetical protein ACKOEX_07715 [Planctomycetia bacterium]
MVCRSPDRSDLTGRIARGLPSLRVIKRSPHPRGHGQPLAARKAPDFVEFVIRKQHL